MTIQTHLFLYQHLIASANTYRDHCAVADEHVRLTYGQLHTESFKLALELQRAGVVTGDRVILLMDNSVSFAISFWAIQYAGAVATPLSSSQTAEELAWIIDNCSPAAIMVDPNHERVVADSLHLLHVGRNNPNVIIMNQVDAGPAPLTTAAKLPPCDGKIIDQDLGCIIYTSGSTGSPKGVMLSQQNLVTASRSVCTYLGYSHRDIVFVTVPLSFDYGMHQLTMACLVGATAVIERNFNKPIFSLHRLSTSNANVFPIVPAMVPLIDALADRYDFSAVRMITSTAAALHSRHIERLQHIFTNAQVFSMYGLTECHRCTYLPPQEASSRKGSVGIAIPNTEMWVIDPDGRRHTKNATGELVIRGSTVMKGYWNNPEQTAKRLRPGRFAGEFVFHTGDLCRLDDDGYLYFLSRSDDVLKIKGQKVIPKEIEDVLLAHPEVLEAVVIGLTDEDLGHRLYALITLRPGASARTQALKAWCKQHLKPISVPHEIRIMPVLEKTTNGKIDRQLLAATLKKDVAHVSNL